MSRVESLTLMSSSVAFDRNGLGNFSVADDDDDDDDLFRNELISMAP